MAEIKKPNKLLFACWIESEKELPLEMLAKIRKELFEEITKASKHHFYNEEKDGQMYHVSYNQDFAYRIIVSKNINKGNKNDFII